AFHWQVTALVSSVIRWVLLLALLIVSLDILYTILPDVDLRFSFFRPGTMVATTSFVLMSGGFSLYISHFNNYNKMYGSLGTVILLLLYLYLFALAILLGVELNAMTEKPVDPSVKR
ncbi:MAG: YhjD/YihY/BrkB family envelope integrity protein, partial [Bacilli bacterium]